MLQDSGERTKFKSGAVRDLSKGKGRMDLVPLDTLASFLTYCAKKLKSSRQQISLYIKYNVDDMSSSEELCTTNEKKQLENLSFGGLIIGDIYDAVEEEKGGNPDIDFVVSKIFDSIIAFSFMAGIDICSMIIELSKHYEDGAIKYEEDNWKKGIPLKSYVDSGVRHLIEYIRGDTDDPHGRAFIWNMFGYVWTFRHHILSEAVSSKGE